MSEDILACRMVDGGRDDLLDLVNGVPGANNVIMGITIDAPKGTMAFTMQVMEAERRLDEMAAIITGMQQGRKTAIQKLVNNIG